MCVGVGQPHSALFLVKLCTFVEDRIVSTLLAGSKKLYAIKTITPLRNKFLWPGHPVGLTHVAAYNIRLNWFDSVSVYKPDSLIGDVRAYTSFILSCFAVSDYPASQIGLPLWSMGGAHAPSSPRDLVDCARKLCSTMRVYDVSLFTNFWGVGRTLGSPLLLLPTKIHTSAATADLDHLVLWVVIHL